MATGAAQKSRAALKSRERSLRLSASTLCVAVLFLTLISCPISLPSDSLHCSIYLTARAHGLIMISRNDPGPVTSMRCKIPRHARQASRDEIVQALSLLSFTGGQRSRYNLYACMEGESLEIEANSNPQHCTLSV